MSMRATNMLIFIINAFYGGRGMWEQVQDMHVEMHPGELGGSQFLLSNTDARDETQVIRLGAKCCYPLSCPYPF